MLSEVRIRRPGITSRLDAGIPVERVPTLSNPRLKWGVLVLLGGRAILARPKKRSFLPSFDPFGGQKMGLAYRVKLYFTVGLCLPPRSRLGGALRNDLRRR